MPQLRKIKTRNNGKTRQTTLTTTITNNNNAQSSSSKRQKKNNNKKTTTNKNKNEDNKNVKKKNDLEEAERKLISDPYRKLTEYCHPEIHSKKKKNCEDNPNCLYGFVNTKVGIWGSRYTFFNSSLGRNPENDKRDMESGTPCGLVNLGATCYVNSLLQVLFFDKVFRDALYSWKPRIGSFNISNNDNNNNNNNNNNSNGFINDLSEENSLTSLQQEIIQSMQTTFAHMEYGKTLSFNPRDFVSKLNLSTGIQQDGIEFNKLLLTMLEQIFLHASKPSLNMFIQNRYGGELCYCTKCLKCNRVSRRKAPFYELELQIESCKTVKESLQAYFNHEELNGDNKYYCDMNCNQKCDAERYTEVCNLPKVINLQLMRFVFDMTTFRKKKVKSAIKIPLMLKSSDFLGSDLFDSKTNGSSSSGKSNSAPDIIYDLVAVLYHRGSSADSGHYVADIRAMDGKWWNCNDQLAEKKIFEKAKKGKKKDNKAKSKAPSTTTTTTNSKADDKPIVIDVNDNDDHKSKTKDNELDERNRAFLKNATYFGNPSQNAYMLVYRQREEIITSNGYNNGTGDNKKEKAMFLQSVEKANDEFDKKLNRYIDEKEKLSAEIDARIESYNKAFKNPEVDEQAPPYVQPGEKEDEINNDFVWVPRKWLQNFVVGQEVITKKAKKGGNSNNTNGNTSTVMEKEVVNLIDDDDADAQNQETKDNNEGNSPPLLLNPKGIYDEVPDFSAIQCRHSADEKIFFSPKLVPKLKLVRKTNLQTLISASQNVTIDMFRCLECETCRKEFREEFIAKNSLLNEWTELRSAIDRNKSELSKSKNPVPLLSKDWIKRLKGNIKTLETYRKDTLIGKLVFAPKKNILDHFQKVGSKGDEDVKEVGNCLPCPTKTSTSVTTLENGTMSINGIPSSYSSTAKEAVDTTPVDIIESFQNDQVNKCVKCEHGHLIHNYGTKTQKISETTWKKVSKYFIKSNLKFTFENVCPVCKGESEEVKSVTKAKKTQWQQRVALFTGDKHLKSLLQRHKKRFHPLKSKRKARKDNQLMALPLDPGVYRVLSREWLMKWRAFCHNVKNPEPEAMTDFPCYCTCNAQGTLLPSTLRNWLNTTGEKNYDEYLDDLPQTTLSSVSRAIEIVTSDEWEKLKIYYGSDLVRNSSSIQKSEPIAFSILPGKSNNWTPNICEICKRQQTSMEAQEKVEFENKTIDVMKLKKDAVIDDVIAAKNAQLNGESTKRRRTKRTSALGTTKSIVTSSTDKVSLLKMKLLEQFTGIDDANLGLLVLYKGKQKLDNESTLREASVHLGDVLFLRVLNDFDDPDAEDVRLADVFSNSDVVKKKKPRVERGFQGSVFQSAVTRKSTSPMENEIDLTKDLPIDLTANSPGRPKKRIKLTPPEKTTGTNDVVIITNNATNLNEYVTHSNNEKGEVSQSQGSNYSECY